MVNFSGKRIFDTIKPGKPTQNAYIERFNRTARNEWLNMHIFDSIEHSQSLATQWMWVYNNERPHSIVPQQIKTTN